MIAAEGKTVAIVGRAEYLETSGLGEVIDGAGYVVRINWTLPIERSKVRHFGQRTDLLYTLRTQNWRKLHRLGKENGATTQVVDAELRDEIAGNMKTGKETYRYIPNTGTVAIYDALRRGATEVRAYGFDLHTSSRHVDTGKAHNARNRWASQRAKPANYKTHNPDLDRVLLRNLLESEPRFQPDEVLRDLLESEPPTPSVTEAIFEALDRWLAEAKVLARYGDQRGADITSLHVEEVRKILEAPRS